MEEQWIEVEAQEASVQEYLRYELERAAAGKGSSSPPPHIDSTKEERNELGTSGLLEISMDWKRILSPMLSYTVVQEALVLLLRESKQNKCDLRSGFTLDTKQVFSNLLTDMKAFGESERRRLPQRHEPWVDLFREQVDIAPGNGVPRRVVDVRELAEILTLANEIKSTGNESFKEHDYAQAVTRYVQVSNVLKDIRAVRPEEEAMIDEVRLKATRNLSLAALKNWEWSRARRACDTVLEALSEEARDHVVRLRRAEANKQLGRYEPAYVDIEAVLGDAELDSNNPVARKARRMNAEMLKSDKQSAHDLRGPLSKGLSTASIFSNDRIAAIPDEPSPEEDIAALEKLPSLHRFRAMRARGLLSNTTQRISPADEATQVPPPRRKTFLLDLDVVEQIQSKQLELFSSPKVLRQLDEIRMAADMEQRRFFLRIKPFKVEVQRELLKEHNFPDTEEGLAAMERAVAAHMANSKEVAMRAKDLMLLIMGDIW